MSSHKQLAISMIQAMHTLSAAVSKLRFGKPVTAVYNPLDYARAGAEAYLSTYAQPCRAMLVGINPGPFGMAQTGVPFGEVAAVRDWLGIQVTIGQPEQPHPKRPISGFACTRSEVSGRRLWGFFKARYATPKQFFADFHLANYCPLVFMEESGKNITPDKLPAAERAPLYQACDRHLIQITKLLKPDWIIGVGNFATKRSREVLGEGYHYLTVPHPSPANPLANRGWDELACAALRPLGFLPEVQVET